MTDAATKITLPELEQMFGGTVPLEAYTLIVQNDGDPIDKVRADLEALAERKRAEQNTYLGDGVYASFDGYQIWLAANHHTNKVVALDISVIHGLMGYAKRVGLL